MSWIPDVLVWLCRFGCVEDPAAEIRKMAPHIRAENMAYSETPTS